MLHKEQERAQKEQCGAALYLGLNVHSSLNFLSLCRDGREEIENATCGVESLFLGEGSPLAASWIATEKSAGGRFSGK